MEYVVLASVSFLLVTNFRRAKVLTKAYSTQYICDVPIAHNTKTPAYINHSHIANKPLIIGCIWVEEALGSTHQAEP